MLVSLFWACNEQILLIRQIRKSVQRDDDVTEYISRCERIELLTLHSVDIRKKTIRQTNLNSQQHENISMRRRRLMIKTMTISLVD